MFFNIIFCLCSGDCPIKNISVQIIVAAAYPLIVRYDIEIILMFVAMLSTTQ